MVCDAAKRTVPVVLSMPAAEASTSPSLSPATSSGSVARSARTIGTGSMTVKSASDGGSAAPGGVARLISSTKGITGVSAIGGPKLLGAAEADGGSCEVHCCHVEIGCGVRKRSYCRSLRSTTSPTPISRASAGSDDGS